MNNVENYINISIKYCNNTLIYCNNVLNDLYLCLYLINPQTLSATLRNMNLRVLTAVFGVLGAFEAFPRVISPFNYIQGTHSPKGVLCYG